MAIKAILAASLSGCAGSERESKITDADTKLRNSAEDTVLTKSLFVCGKHLEISRQTENFITAVGRLTMHIICLL